MKTHMVYINHHFESHRFLMLDIHFLGLPSLGALFPRPSFSYLNSVMTEDRAFSLTYGSRFKTFTGEIHLWAIIAVLIFWMK